MIRSLHILLRHSVLAAFVLAMLALPFVQRAGAEPVTAELTQFISMGGKLSDICGEFGGHRAGGCESCNICAGMVLPQFVQLLRPLSAPTPLDVVTVGQTDSHPPAAETTPPVRAPPRA